MGIGILHDLRALVDDAARVFAAHDVVEPEEHVARVLDDVQAAQGLARERMEHFLGRHGERPVLAHVAGVEAVLAVDDAQDDHAPRRVEEKAVAADDAEGFFLILVNADQGDLFHLGVAPVLAVGEIGGEGAVALAHDPQQETLAHLVELAGEERA